MNPPLFESANPMLATRYRSRAVIRLTPLIDVVFILLVFFMLSSSFVEWKSLSLTIPSSGAGGKTDRRVLSVGVTADKRLQINGKQYAFQDLAMVVNQYQNDGSDISIVVQPATGTRLQTTIELIDLLTSLGHEDISLVSSD